MAEFWEHRMLFMRVLFAGHEIQASCRTDGGSWKMHGWGDLRTGGGGQVATDFVL